MIKTMITNMVNHLNPAFTTENKRDSLQLEQIRNWDFSSVEAELKAAFVHSKFRALNFNLAHRVSVDGAGQYDEVPMRSFKGAGDIAARRWEDVYQALRVDDVMLDAEQAGVLSNCYILGVWPDEAGDLVISRFLPHEIVEVDFGINLFSTDDIGKAERVVLARVIPQPGMLSASAWVVRIELTKAEAWTIYPDGTRRGLFSDAGDNPLGRVPLVGRRRAVPVASGYQQDLSAVYVPRVSQDVLSVQLGMIVGVSQAVGITTAQSHAKVIVSGDEAGMKGMPTKIIDTPDNLIHIPGLVTITPLTLNPPIEKLIRSLETAMYYLSQMRYLRPEAYAASIVTGAARRADAEGFHASQRRQERACLTLERALNRLIADVYDITQKTALKLGEVDLHVEYRQVKSLENVLQEEQARSVRIANYMTDYVREIAREERITEAAAQELLMQRMAAKREMLQDALPASPAGATESTPGLDKLAPEVAGAPMAVEGDTAVADTALNGAQVAALQGVMESVSAGLLAAESAKIMVEGAFPSFSVERIAQMVDAAASQPAPRAGAPTGFEGGGGNV